MHLVEMDFALSVREVEEFAADMAELDGSVRKFPLAIFLRGDG